MRREFYRRRYRAVSPLFPLLLIMVFFVGIGLPIVMETFHVASVDEEGNWVRQKTIPGHHTLLETSFVAMSQRILNGSRHFGEELDIHLFVVWQQAFSVRDLILEDIRRNFVVLDLIEFDWISPPADPKEFLFNLWVLYSGKDGWAREGMTEKVRQCGYGNFIALVVANINPQYASKDTAHGSDIVNVMMHAKKELYRIWSGGGFKVHGTFSNQEANHDIRVLFHTTPENILHRALYMRTYSADIARTYLKDAPSFVTRQEAFDGSGNSNNDDNRKVENPEGKREKQQHQGWQCDSFLFALGTLTQVTVTDGETGNVLWSRRTPPSGLPFVVESVTKIKCAEWPETLEFHMPSSEMWGIVALLRASPVRALRATLNSNFTVRLEGSTRILRLKPVS